MIFEDQQKNLSRVCNIILQDLGEQKTTQDTSTKRIDRPPILNGKGQLVSLMGHHRKEDQSAGLEPF
jgi:hypothetical protein